MVAEWGGRRHWLFHDRFQSLRFRVRRGGRGRFRGGIATGRTNPLQQVLHVRRDRIAVTTVVRQKAGGQRRGCRHGLFRYRFGGCGRGRFDRFASVLQRGRGDFFCRRRFRFLGRLRAATESEQARQLRPQCRDRIGDAGRMARFFVGMPLRIKVLIASINLIQMRFIRMSLRIVTVSDLLGRRRSGID